VYHGFGDGGNGGGGGGGGGGSNGIQRNSTARQKGSVYVGFGANDQTNAESEL
jgi:hypothetical protein